MDIKEINSKKLYKEYLIEIPFEDIDKEKFEQMMRTLSDVDLTRVIELDDETDLSGELACAGGACEIV